MRKIHQTFRIDPEVLKKVEKIAKDEQRKVCQVYEIAVNALVLQKELSKSKPKKS